MHDLFPVKAKLKAIAKKSKRGAALEEGWKPTVELMEYGHRLGFDDKQIDDMAEDMRLWAGANSNRAVARKANWELTFMGWMRREAKRNGAKNGQARRGGGFLDNSIAFAEALGPGRDRTDH